MSSPTWQLEAECGPARAGWWVVRGQRLPTPLFAPVATRGAVRGQPLPAVAAAGTRALLANAFHLRGRAPQIARWGGLHAFLGWSGGLITDSGGYQAFSLAGTRFDDQGVDLQDPQGGGRVRLTPASVMDLQRCLAPDVAMILDHCPPGDAGPDLLSDAVARTSRWAEQAALRRAPGDPAWFAIVQGGPNLALRRASVAALRELPFEGYALGGLAVGEAAEARAATLAACAPLLPRDQLRYLMGVGTPADLVAGVAAGMDLFDCILPVAHAQHGLAYTMEGKRDLRRGIFREDAEPLEVGCPCPTCSRHPRAWLHHLVKARELNGWIALAEHNLWFFQRLMAMLREMIVAGTLQEQAPRLERQLAAPCADRPVVPPRAKVRRRPPLERGDYRLAEAAGGWWTVVQRSSGEAMHSVNPPGEEARRLYVEQSGLADRLALDGPPLVVWDVGLGAAANAAAAWAVRGSKRRLHLVSFERDLDPLRLVLDHPERLPDLPRRALHALLRQGVWSEDGHQWTLVDGDFLETLSSAPAPEVVFYDPFSFRAEGRMWTLSALQRVAQVLPWGGQIFTFSNATPVRAAWLVSGLRVGSGLGSGPKAETTVAARGVVPGPRELGPAWLQRWERSSRPWPVDVGPEEAIELERRLRSVPSLGGAVR